MAQFQIFPESENVTLIVQVRRCGAETVSTNLHRTKYDISGWLWLNGHKSRENNKFFNVFSIPKIWFMHSFSLQNKAAKCFCTSFIQRWNREL